MTPAQQEYVSGEITRRLAVFNHATTAAVATQFEIEKRDISIASQAFEERITSTIHATVEGRQSVLNEQLIAAFVHKNAEMRKAEESLKFVMEAIGGEKFGGVSVKMANLDKSQSHNVALLRDMFGKNTNDLRDRMPAHDRSFQEAFVRLDRIEQSARVDLPRGDGGSSRLKIPDPAGWKLQILKGREDGFQL